MIGLVCWLGGLFKTKPGEKRAVASSAVPVLTLNGYRCPTCSAILQTDMAGPAALRCRFCQTMYEQPTSLLSPRGVTHARCSR